MANRPTASAALTLSADEIVAKKLHSMLDASIDCSLRSGSIVVFGPVAMDVVVAYDGSIGIISSMGAGHEQLPAGKTYAEIAAHLNAIALGKCEKAMSGSGVLRSVGAQWESHTAA